MLIACIVVNAACAIVAAGFRRFVLAAIAGSMVVIGFVLLLMGVR